ncbi:deoxyuridine 5'-triphosphate nucleotidohydrolase-like [Uloborus diversus]|uniref:deoxyuridine 5'-triphosphate nucleotidohydrolase-like n=1 Tax=Uloborus diversus TaxID=327109 RepID=UPI0024098A08|nr:deoxyuridine 5'-triphosphate nucleotidohydrolase-like [Uloborus diversus]
MDEIAFIKTHVKAKTPRKQTNAAAGFDLYTPTDFMLDAGERKLIDTGICFQIPESCYGRLAEKSRLALLFNLEVKAGVIDSDYRGSVKVLLKNDGRDKLCFREGDPICQIIFEKYHVVQLKQALKLSSSERGSRAFGDENHGV